MNVLGRTATASIAAAILAVLTVFSAETRQPWTASRVLGSPEKAARFKLERGFGGIQFTNPLDLAFNRTLNRWFVAEQGGRILSLATNGSGLELAADLGPLQGPEGALYAITFDPGFASNHFAYACYALKPELPEGSRVSRFKVAADGKIDLRSEEILITWLSGGHNGCCLKFGPDGFLYISTGDGAGPNPPDPLKTGQNVSDLLSSVLRIDVHKAEAGKRYSVPNDNPFVSQPGARSEIWAYGFRNPWRMGFDMQTGDLWVADVGWELWELIFRVQRGGNYGWSIVEGRQPVLPNDPVGPTPILPPAHEHPHSEAASITGGVVYYGTKFPELRGAFVYGDWETGKIWALKADRERVTQVEELADSTTRIVSFEADAQGEIAVLDYNGGLYWLIANPSADAPADFPTRLSETGLFASLKDLAPAPGVHPFEVAAPMWRDFATAKRVVALPGLSTIDTAGRPWKFPSNAVLALTYSLDMELGHPQTRRRIETQVLHQTGDGWNAYSYRWNPEQTEALLVPAEGGSETIEVKDISQPGGIRRQPWRFHSRTECLRCHNSWCGTALGFQPEQLGSQLAQFLELGLFSKRPAAGFKLSNPNDANASMPDRARSYLHANCSHCHRENAGGSVPSVMNFDQPLDKTRMIGARPVLGDLGLAQGKVIAPGEPFRSVLLFRVSSTGRSRMPYLSSELVDEGGVALLREWIASLGPNSGTEITEHPANGSEALRLAHALPAFPKDKRAAIARQAAQAPNPLFRELFERFLPAEEQTVRAEAPLTAEAILALRGDARRGAALFADLSRTTCIQCHVIGAEGNAYGPDLAVSAAKKSRAELLESIREPSKEISVGYELHTIELVDDEPLSGIITRRTEISVFLRDAAGLEHVIPQNKIRSIRRNELSAMPEGLLNGLSAQEAADLLEAIVQSAKRTKH